MKKHLIYIILLLGLTIQPITQGLVYEKSNHEMINGNILNVGGTGPGNYTLIQDAIDNASDGDTIFVYNKTYYEHLEIKKKLNIIGRNQKDTIISGIEESSFIIKLSGMSSGTKITGFTINSDKIESYGGILLSHSSDNIIENNTFIIPKDMGSWSILFYSGYNNIIKNNKISGHGIEIEDSNYNIIIENDIIDARDAIELERSNNNLIESNLIKDCITVSISGPSDNNIIINNTFNGNLQGVGIYSSKGNKIIGNNFENNRIGIHLFWCGYNYIHKNNFKNNYKNADVVGNWKRPINSWNENYWDDWIGLSSPLFWWIPKFIEGEIMLGIDKSIKCFNFDFNPVKEPYYIGV
jgi:parallel beta-helix repeat protein